MKAKLTADHTLYLGQYGAPARGKLTPNDPQADPGIWISWLLDKQDKLVPGSQFQVGFGEFEEAYKRKAYDKSVAFLQEIGGADALIDLENLRWS